MHAWDSGQHLRFADERTRPARDLMARLDLAGTRRVINLGRAPRRGVLDARRRQGAAPYPRLFVIATPR